MQAASVGGLVLITTLRASDGPARHITSRIYIFVLCVTYQRRDPG